MMEYWSCLIFFQSLTFTTANKITLNRNESGDIWLNTTCKKEDICWLVDTGSPKSFKSKQTAKNLMKMMGKNLIKKDANVGEFRCSNKNKIQIGHTINQDLKSGKSSANNCQIFIVPQNTVNLLGRDILQRFGIQLAYLSPGEKNTKHTFHTKQHCKMCIPKYPHLCTSLVK